ncbi:mitochondrial uncoupling protein 4-like isoform X2 [Periplaneta americana]
MAGSELARNKWVDSVSCNYVVAVISAAHSELVTFPLDLIKTRLQVQGEVAAAKEGVSVAPYKGLFGTGKEIVQEEGFFRLWRGLTPAIYRHVVYSGVRIVIYQQLRTYVLKTESDGSYPLWKSGTNAVISGVCAQFLANPTDLVKIHMQMEGKRRLLGLPLRVRSPKHAFQVIFTAGGIKGLWAGTIPNMQRAAAVNLGDLAAYDKAKRFFLSFPLFTDNIITHTLASLVAGLVSAIMTTPFDTIRTRLMNQPIDDQGRGLLYKGTTDCFIQSIRNEGLLALYKGFVPLWLRLGPWALVFWVSFENIKKLLGATAF